MERIKRGTCSVVGSEPYVEGHFILYMHMKEWKWGCGHEKHMQFDGNIQNIYLKHALMKVKLKRDLDKMLQTHFDKHIQKD